MVQREKLDRRSRRSRRLVVDALLALLREKRYDRITVQEIIDRADVGRSTFYAQFRNKDAVLESELEHVFGRLHEQHLAFAQESRPHLLPTLGLFQHIQETQSFYPALIRGLASGSHEAAVHRSLRDLALRQLAHAAGPTPLAVPAEIIADYLASSVLTLTHWWLDHGSAFTPEQMEAVFQQLVMPGIRAVLPNPEGELGKIAV